MYIKLVKLQKLQPNYKKKSYIFRCKSPICAVENKKYKNEFLFFQPDQHV